MRHEDVWRALDTLAAEKGLSPSGLARAAGLDPTAFNRSKRTTVQGRLRWPSTESLSRVLAATGATLETFCALVGGARALAGLRPGGRGMERIGYAARRLPCLTFSALQAGADPAERGEEMVMPMQADPGSYAIRLDSAAYEPVFREGGLLIASPEASVRSQDRMVLKPFAGPLSLCLLSAAMPQEIEVTSLAQPGTIRLKREAVEWMHRIGWTSV